MRTDRPGFTISFLCWCVLLCSLSACARVSDPLPPLILIPKRTTALELRQIGNQVRLSFPRPTVNTDGSLIQSLREIRIYRLAEKRTAAAGGMNDQGFRSKARMVGFLSAAEWESAVSLPTLQYTDDLHALESGAPFESTLYYAVEFVSRKGRSEGLSNLQKISLLPIPAPPAAIRSLVQEDRIELEWDSPQSNSDGSKPARIAGYNVYRSFENPARFDRPLNAAMLESARFTDRDFAFGKDASYAVSIMGSKSDPIAESTLSKSVLVQPRDTFPPAVPSQLEIFGISNAISLRWDANKESDLAGYFVYRSDDKTEKGARLNDKAIRETSYVDHTAESQKTYYYRVTAVDRMGNESSPTPSVAGSLSLPISANLTECPRSTMNIEY